jgi:hypothetical protein
MSKLQTIDETIILKKKMLKIPVQDREESTWSHHQHKFPLAEKHKCQYKVYPIPFSSNQNSTTIDKTKNKELTIQEIDSSEL